MRMRQQTAATWGRKGISSNQIAPRSAPPSPSLQRKSRCFAAYYSVPQEKKLEMRTGILAANDTCFTPHITPPPPPLPSPSRPASPLPYGGHSAVFGTVRQFGRRLRTDGEQLRQHGHQHPLRLGSGVLCPLVSAVSKGLKKVDDVMVMS